MSEKPVFTRPKVPAGVTEFVTTTQKEITPGKFFVGLRGELKGPGRYNGPIGFGTFLATHTGRLPDTPDCSPWATLL